MKIDQDRRKRETGGSTPLASRPLVLFLSRVLRRAGPAPVLLWQRVRLQRPLLPVVLGLQVAFDHEAKLHPLALVPQQPLRVGEWRRYGPRLAPLLWSVHYLSGELLVPDVLR